MLRSLMTVSGFTLISRILGFLRDILIARFIGTGLVGDAFFAAFRFPNLFRRIFGEGAFNAAFVPMFGKRVIEEPVEAMKFASRAFSMLLFVLGVFTLIAIPAMPWVMNLVVPGFKAREVIELSAEGEEFEINTKGARAVYVQLEGQGELKVQEARFEKEVEKSLWSLFGKGKTEGFDLSEPFVEEGSVIDFGTYVAPLDGEERWKNRVRQRAFVVEGAEWSEGAFVVKEGAEYVKIARPKGKAGRGMKYFSAKVSGEGTVEVFRNHPDSFPLTVKLARIMFIYLLCMALAAHLSGVLNTFQIFGMPAAAPIILNVVFLLGLGGVWLAGWASGETLAWSVMIAGFLQLAALWLTAWKKGAPVKVVVPRFDEEMKRLFGLMGPGVASASVQQINLLIGGVIASFQPGAVSYLYYSDRVYQLPLGMIGIALGVVLLPEVTRQLRGGMERQAGKTIVKGVELGMLLTLPAAVAMMVVPTELIGGLFQRGEFVRADAVQTGRALAAFGAGLPGYVLIKVFQPGYFAKEDTKSPMKMAVVMVSVNIVMSLLLFPWLGHVGLAVATSIAAWVNVWMLARGLKGFVKFTESTLFRLGRMVSASILMGVVLWFASNGLSSWFAGDSVQRIGALILLVGTGLSAYGALVLFLRATSVRELKAGLGKG